MPVRSRHSRDEHQRMRPSYESDYSFKTRDYSAKDFARSRRFGDDPIDDSRTMSYVSSPLQMPVVGSRRTFSPYRTNQSYNGLVESDEEENMSYSRQERSRKSERQPRRNPYIEEAEDDDFLVPTFQPRRRQNVNVYRPNPRFNSNRHVQNTPEEDGDYEMAPRRVESSRRSTGYSQSKQKGEEEYSYRVESPVEDDYRKRINRESEIKEEYNADQMDEEDEAPIKPQPRPRQRVLEATKEHEETSNRYRKRQPYNDPLSTDLGYIVPASRRREDPSEENDDASMRHMASYIAKRKEFAIEDDEEMQHLRNSGYQYRILGNAYPLVTNAAAELCMEKEKLSKAPMFDMKLRSHVSWEKMNVKFMCKVRGHPQPTITWYHNMVPVATSASDPGKFKITNQFGMHCLEINRVTLDDSGTYRVSAQNHKGEISCYATLLVRRYNGSRLGRYDPSTGTYNRHAVDFPDVENLDIPDKNALAQERWKKKLRSLEDDIGRMVKEETYVSSNENENKETKKAEKEYFSGSTETSENFVNSTEPAVISNVVAEIISSDDVTSTTQVISTLSDVRNPKPKPKVTFSNTLYYEGDKTNGTVEENNITSSTNINITKPEEEVAKTEEDFSSASTVTTTTSNDTTKLGQDRYLVAINVQMKKSNKIAEVLSPTKPQSFTF